MKEQEKLPSTYLPTKTGRWCVTEQQIANVLASSISLMLFYPQSFNTSSWYLAIFLSLSVGLKGHIITCNRNDQWNRGERNLESVLSLLRRCPEMCGEPDNHEKIWSCLEDDVLYSWFLILFKSRPRSMKIARLRCALPKAKTTSNASTDWKRRTESWGFVLRRQGEKPSERNSTSRDRLFFKRDKLIEIVLGVNFQIFNLQLLQIVTCGLFSFSILRRKLILTNTTVIKQKTFAFEVHRT